ncbi:MAG: recombination mediator RecR [Cyclobacteriaceae bacterium]|nr:recombination mediator RecR [Cyclobacteriaceae bacterium]
MDQYPSQLIENAVKEISRLPGIGKKSALRIVLHLLKKDSTLSKDLANSIVKMREETQYCEICGNISDQKTCQVCLSPRRDRSILCVVEDTRDVLAIENTGQYNGLYHVLGGLISPLDGMGPEELNIGKLQNRLKDNLEIKEILLALSPNMEGDTTAFYLSKKIASHGIKLSSIARGIPIGGELEYADEITLGRSIASRIQYNQENK